MIKNIDVASRVSSPLSVILEAHVNDPNAIQEATLGSVRAYLTASDLEERYEADLLHPETANSLLVELDDLIDEFGVEAPAEDFVTVQASEALSRVIQEVMDNADLPPTLEAVHVAMERGLVAHLVGEGAIEDDEDDTLQAELEELMDRYGPDTPAEQFLRYE